MLFALASLALAADGPLDTRVEVRIDDDLPVTVVRLPDTPAVLTTFYASGDRRCEALLDGSPFGSSQVEVSVKVRCFDVGGHEVLRVQPDVLVPRGSSGSFNQQSSAGRVEIVAYGPKPTLPGPGVRRSFFATPGAEYTLVLPSAPADLTCGPGVKVERLIVDAKLTLTGIRHPGDVAELTCTGAKGAAVPVAVSFF